jgi:hypothetical protein
VRGNDEVAELGRAFNFDGRSAGAERAGGRSMVSDVAHELRTPLTSIRVQIEAVQDGVSSPTRNGSPRSTKTPPRSRHLVDDLQQLSLADAGALRLELADVAVAEHHRARLERLGAEGITITVDVPADLTIRADARRLVQVVRNLVVNALAFASSAITISAAASDRTASRSASPTTAPAFRPNTPSASSTASTAPTLPLPHHRRRRPRPGHRAPARRAPRRHDPLRTPRVHRAPITPRRSALECVRLAAALGSVPRSGSCHATQSGGKPRALQSAPRGAS